MSELIPEIDEMPQLKTINVFETKETLVNKNKNGNVIHSERLSRNIHLTPPLSLSSSHTAYINRVQNDIKLDDTLIDSFNYIHCRNCFAFLAKETKLNYEYSKFLKIENNLSCTNIRIDESSHVFCSRCELLIGLKVNFILLLKKKIKVRPPKTIELSLLGLKIELLNKIKEEVRKINTQGITLNITVDKRTKDNIDKYKCSKKNNDITFIVHKIEGRVFLLGKNGFYNKVVEVLKKKNNHNIYFILVIKEDDDKIRKAMIEDLINKGGQKDLDYYYKNNRIVFINDFNIETDFANKKDFFINIFKTNYDNTKSKGEYLQEDEDEMKKDLELINKVIGYELNGGNSNIFAKCSMI